MQPKIQVASKYERRVDTRSYDDKKKLFEGVSSTIIIQGDSKGNMFITYYIQIKTFEKSPSIHRLYKQLHTRRTKGIFGMFQS